MVCVCSIGLGREGFSIFLVHIRMAIYKYMYNTTSRPGIKEDCGCWRCRVSGSDLLHW